MADFNLVDSIDKAIQSLLQKVKCSVSVIGQVLGETDFKKDYIEYKASVEDIFQNDLAKCAQEDGIQLKFT